MSNTTRRVRSVDATLRESQRRRATRSRALRTGLPADLAGSGEAPVRGPRPQRSRTWAVGALVLLFVLAGVGWQLLRDDAGTAVDAPAAVVEVFLGQATGGTPGGDGLLPLAVGSALGAGDVAETGAIQGEASGVALRLASGPSVRIDQGSRIQMVSDSVITLDRGAVYVDSRRAGDAIEVRTTLGVVRDIGTQFEVRLVEDDDVAGLQIRVREGRIDLEAGGQHHEAGAGEQLTQLADGELIREAISIHGPEWDWVLSSAAVPELEGLSLGEFLDWFAREGGWTLDYADTETADRARETILHGTNNGLSAREAADLVFLGSGLSYRVDPEGRLEVTSE